MPHLDLSPHFRPYYEIHDFSDPDATPETVLFIHGFTENTQVWRNWVPGLARQYRLLTFDIRGFGQTGPVDADFRYSTDLLVDDIVRIVNALVGTAVHVVSGKSGAITATRFAATRPDLVKSMVLTCPPLTAPGSTDWLDVMETRGMRAWARETMPARLGASASARTMDWWVDVMGETALSTAKAYLRWVVDTKPDEDLAKAQCPVLVVMTKPTERTNVTAGLVTPQRIKEVLPAAEIEMLDIDCYHAAAIAPDACAAAAKAFFERTAQVGAARKE